MTKYNEQFKLAVVQQYLSDTPGFKALAKTHGLHRKMVEQWVNLHRLHGTAGLEKKFTHYSAEFKLSVLRHMWDGELSQSQVAAVFNIRSPGCIRHWERCYHSGGLDALIPRPRGKPKNMSTPDIKPPLPPDGAEHTREELVVEVNQLRMEVAYLKKLKALVQSQKQQRTTARKKRK
jgi:transposase